MQATPKRWYNCWLFHSWGRWESCGIKIREWSYSDIGLTSSEWRSAPGQIQTCSACGKYRLAEG
jgi:hypothetical protein